MSGRDHHLDEHYATKEPGMKIYVSGPMTGYAEFNFPAFNEAAEMLRLDGWEVVNPADTGLIDGWTWTDYIRHDLRLISGCDAVHMLGGWRASKGARLERHIALELSLPITGAAK